MGYDAYRAAFLVFTVHILYFTVDDTLYFTYTKPAKGYRFSP
jgi:hypothetical protein